MTDYINYISLVIIEGSEKKYLVDRTSYYLLCSLQEVKPTKKTLEIILDWSAQQKKAIILEHLPITLLFNEKNMTDEDMDF